MKKVMVVLAVLSLTSSLWAADPLIGTWILNIDRSKFPPNFPSIPKEQTETYRELSNDQIELTYQNVDQDGSSSLLIETYSMQGGIAKVQKGDSPYSFVQTRIAQDEWIVTYLRDGKQVGTRHKKISKDGNTLRQTISFNDEGMKFELLLVFDKQ
jgi:hypothetical protein